MSVRNESCVKEQEGHVYNSSVLAQGAAQAPGIGYETRVSAEALVRAVYRFRILMGSDPGTCVWTVAASVADPVVSGLCVQCFVLHGVSAELCTLH